jgi:hypothetical protein
MAMTITSPPFTAVPNEFIDWLLADCSGSEIAVYLYMLRRTAGFQKPSDRISVRQFCNGLRSTKNGASLDRGTGLSIETVSAALTALESKGMAKRDRGSGTKADLWTPQTPQRSKNQNTSTVEGARSVPKNGTHSVLNTGTDSVQKIGTTKERGNIRERKTTPEQHHLPDTSENDVALSVMSILDDLKILCQDRVVVSCRPGEKDNPLVSQWIARGATGETVRHAFVLGCQRKIAADLNSGAASSINSLRYFDQIVDQVLQLQNGQKVAGMEMTVGPAYWKHVEKWIRRYEPAWVKSRDQRAGSRTHVETNNRTARRTGKTLTDEDRAELEQFVERQRKSKVAAGAA